MCCSTDDVHVSSEEHVLKDSDEMRACGIEDGCTVTQRVRGGGVHNLTTQNKTNNWMSKRARTTVNDSQRVKPHSC